MAPIATPLRIPTLPLPLRHLKPNLPHPLPLPIQPTTPSTFPFPLPLPLPPQRAPRAISPATVHRNPHVASATADKHDDPHSAGAEHVREEHVGGVEEEAAAGVGDGGVDWGGGGEGGGRGGGKDSDESDELSGAGMDARGVGTVLRGVALGF